MYSKCRQCQPRRIAGERRHLLADRRRTSSLGCWTPSSFTSYKHQGTQHKTTYWHQEGNSLCEFTRITSTTPSRLTINRCCHLLYPSNPLGALQQISMGSLPEHDFFLSGILSENLPDVEIASPIPRGKRC